MSPIGAGRSLLGWLAIPALFGVLVLTGMAISTESKDDFQDRTSAENAAEQQSGQEQSNDGRTQDQPITEGDGSNQQDGRSQSGEDQNQDPSQETGQQSEESGRSGESGGEDSQPIVIRTPNGDVVVQLGNGDVVTAVPDDSPLPTDPSRTLTPSSDGNLGGVRVTEDGTLEPIDAPELQTRDFGLSPSANGGVEVTRPDGSKVTLEPTADGGITATERSDQVAENIPLDSDVVLQPSDDFPAGHQTSPSAEPLIIETDSGPVRLELNPEGDLVANQPDPDSIVQIDRDDLVAIRVDENGDLEVVPLDEVGPDDTVLVPADDGVDLVRPDGSRIEFRVDGENDGVTATQVTADGEEIELTPNPDGSVTLDDGTTVGPIDFAEDGGAIERLLDQTADLPWAWVFGAIAILTALSVGTAVYLYKNQPDNAFDFSQLAVTGVDVDEFEHFLSVLTNDPDPARAIRLAFYAAERGLAGLPPRRPDETPFEWHHRVAQVRPELAEPLGSICDRFAMVRFAPGHATSEDRDTVVARLRQLNLMASSSANQTNVMAGV